MVWGENNNRLGRGLIGRTSAKKDGGMDPKTNKKKPQKPGPPTPHSTKLTANRGPPRRETDGQKKKLG